MSQWIGVVAYWLIPVMVLVGVWNVFGRFLPQVLGWMGIVLHFNLTSNALIESQWYIFSLVIFMGAPYALLHNEHVRVDVLYAHFSERRKALVNLLGAMLFLIPFCFFLIYFAWSFVGNSWRILEQSPDPSGLPRYPIKTLIPVGAALLMLQAFSEGIKSLACLLDRSQVHHEGAAQAAQEEQATEQPADAQREGRPLLHEERYSRSDEQAQSDERPEEVRS